MSEQSLLMQACERHEREAELLIEAVNKVAQAKAKNSVADCALYQVSILTAQTHVMLAAHYFDREMRDGR